MFLQQHIGDCCSLRDEALGDDVTTVLACGGGMRRRRCVGEGVRRRCRQQGRGALGSLFIGVRTVT
jgi:hypothetical protein